MPRYPASLVLARYLLAGPCGGRPGAAGALPLVHGAGSAADPPKRAKPKAAKRDLPKGFAVCVWRNIQSKVRTPQSAYRSLRSVARLIPFSVSGFFHCRRVVCACSAGAPLVHSLINHFRQIMRQRGDRTKLRKQKQSHTDSLYSWPRSWRVTPDLSQRAHSSKSSHPPVLAPTLTGPRSLIPPNVGQHGAPHA